jgi:8-oxo-dGTP pyrophosphatase MutT (NUDIX family)
MQFSAAVHRLEQALERPLPGPKAHNLVAPRPRSPWPPGFAPAKIRQAAGLLLLFPLDDRGHIVLTERADHLGRHGGQVALPGGVVERGETFEHAALREAHEEIGLAISGVRTLGALTPLDIMVSGFRLHPVAAAVFERPRLTAADGEVARILEVDLDLLLEPGRVHQLSMKRDGTSIVAPSFIVGELAIWGATAMVIAEYLQLLGWSGPSST